MAIAIGMHLSALPGLCMGEIPAFSTLGISTPISNHHGDQAGSWADLALFEQGGEGNIWAMEGP